MAGSRPLGVEMAGSRPLMGRRMESLPQTVVRVPPPGTQLGVERTQARLGMGLAKGMRAVMRWYTCRLGVRGMRFGARATLLHMVWKG